MRPTVALRGFGRYVILDIDGAEAVVADYDVRAGRRVARAVMRALGLPGRDVRRLCGHLHARYTPGAYTPGAYAPRRGSGPARAVMPTLEWTDILGFPVPTPVRLPRRSQALRGTR